MVSVFLQVANVNKTGEAPCAKFIKKRIVKELCSKTLSPQIANVTNLQPEEISVMLFFVITIARERGSVKIMDHVNAMMGIQDQTVVSCK
jgi:hypothetical protein